MAMYSARVWWLTITLLLWIQQAYTRNTTHEDIRDAIVSITSMVRTSQVKLERHELREKTLGEQFKRMLNNLDKKHRVLEPLKEMISRLDERLTNIETIYLQREEKEKSFQNKINIALESIQNNLVTLIPKPKTTEELNNEKLVQNDLQMKLEAMDAKINAVTNEIRNLKNSLNPESLRGLCSQVDLNVNPFEKYITKAEKLLNKYELKLKEYNVTISVQSESMPLNEVAAANGTWHNKMSEVMERQEKNLIKINHLLSDAESMWKDLPRVADLDRSTKQIVKAVSNFTEILILNNGLVMERQDEIINKTQHLSDAEGICKDVPRLADLHNSTEHIAQAISNATETLVSNSISDASNLVSHLRAMGDTLAATNENVRINLTESNKITEKAYNNISRSFEMLRPQIQLLSENEQQIPEISNNVLAIKKRLGIVVSQVVLELHKDIQGIHSKIITNENLRLDSLERAIIENQTKALTNVSLTLDSEMSQVWRQNEFTYQKLTRIQNSVVKLTELSEQNVNRSSADMNTVKTDVSDIKSRILKLEEDMDYALDQLFLKPKGLERKTSGTVNFLNNTNTVPIPKESKDITETFIQIRL